MFSILGNIFFIIAVFAFLFWVLSSINSGKYKYVGGQLHVNRAERRADKIYMKSIKSISK